MFHRTFAPPPPLDEFIENFWYWEGDAPGYGKDTIMASGSMGLLVNLKADELSWYEGKEFGERRTLAGMGLCGACSQSFAIDAHQPRMMGVQFRPGGGYPFFGPSAREFSDLHISLSDIWGARASALHQQLIHAPTVDAKFEILLAALIASAVRGFARDPSVALALQRFHRAPQTASVAATAADAGISAKRLIGLFSAEVGFTPKLYLRVVRFQRLLDRVWQTTAVDWAEVAAAYGYYDQSHLIRDFRQFSGLTPAAYLARRGPFKQHVPIPG